MVNEVLFKHEAPFLDGGEQGLFEWSNIHKEPGVNHLSTLRHRTEAYETITVCQKNNIYVHVWQSQVENIHYSYHFLITFSDNANL